MKYSLIVASLVASSEAINVRHRTGARDLNDDQGNLNDLDKEHMNNLSQAKDDAGDVARSSEQAKDLQQADAEGAKNFNQGYALAYAPSDDTQSLGQKVSATEQIEQAQDLSWNNLKVKAAAFKSKTTWDEPDNLLPEFNFKSAWNTNGAYQDALPSSDFPEMRIQTLRKGDGKNCEIDQWATVNWKAYIGGEDPQEVYNSHRDAAGEGPKQFRVGNYQVSRCWDMAIQMMSKGQVAKVFCPPFLDKGGSRNNFRQTGTNWLKEGQGITYEFEVQSCIAQLEFPKDEPLISKRCIFITMSNGAGRQMALTADSVDKYTPRTTGLYDVGVQDWDGKGSKNRFQQWWWDDADHALHSYAHDDTNAILFEGFNKNLVLYRNLQRDAQKFSYNGTTGFWRNDHTKRAMSIAWENFKGGENVVTAAVDNNFQSAGVKWDIKYCSDEPTNQSAGGATV